MAAYTTTHLLADIKLRVFAPNSASAYEDPDFLLLADAEMQSLIVPFLRSLRADYLVTYKDEAIVADQANYDIPERAVAMQLREVHVLKASGAIDNLALVDLEEIETTSAGGAGGFYLRGNQLFLYQTPRTGGDTLRQYFLLRPSKLIETTSAAEITGIDPVTGVVTVGSMPDSWSTSLTYDLIRKAGGCEPRAIDKTPTGLVAGSSLTFAALPTGLAVGDYVALSGETPIPQIPADLRPLLCAGVAERICEAMQLPGLDSARKTKEEALKAAQVLMTPRVTGAAKKVVQRNGLL